MDRDSLPLHQLRVLLRAVFLSRQSSEVGREAGRRFDALASAGAGVSGGAGEVVNDDTPERLPDLIGQFGDYSTDVDLAVGKTVMPTLHHAALLEAHARA